MAEFTDANADTLAQWVLSKHRAGKHALVFVDTYDIEAVTEAVRSRIPGSQETSKVDFLVHGKWVMFRVLREQMPSAILTDPSYSVCTISP